MGDSAEHDGRKRDWQKFMYGYNTAMCLGLGPPMVLAPGGHGDAARRSLPAYTFALNGREGSDPTGIAR